MTTLRSDTGEDIRHPWPPFRGIIILSTSCLKKVITKHKMNGLFIFIFQFMSLCLYFHVFLLLFQISVSNRIASCEMTKRVPELKSIEKSVLKDPSPLKI